MKTSSAQFFLNASLAFALGLVMPLAAQGQSTGNVPEINFQTVPITTAIENLARMADINYIIDPKLFVAADGARKPEPTLTLRWENYTAANALARLLKENHLFMTTNAFTTVVRITDTNAVANPVDAKLLGDDTNGVIPMIGYGDVPLNIALTTLIKQAHVNAILDPQVSGEASPAPPDFKMIMVPTVSIRWHNFTARQAIIELCEDYGLVIVKGSTPDSAIIKLKK
jgi:hypothetical protein